jgi:pimeloyl-ACP methyl ester carboxylesterase
VYRNVRPFRYESLKLPYAFATIAVRNSRPPTKLVVARAERENQGVPISVPETHYAESGEVRIAYQVFGGGPFDIVFAPSLVTHVELQWRVRPWAAFFERLSGLGRVIVFDKRGTGMSDRDVGVPDIEQRMDDIRAVMDAAGSERAALIGTSDGGTMSALFAAMYPQRCWSLILWGSMRRYRFAPDYRGGVTEEEMRQAAAFWAEHPWEDRDGLGELAAWFLPGGHPVDLAAMVDMYLAGADARSYQALQEMNQAMDIRGALRAIDAPTLVIYREKEPPPITDGSRALAELIPDAVLVERPGEGHFPFGGDPALAIAHIEEFLRRTWEPRSPTECSRRSCSPTSSARRARRSNWAIAAGASCSTSTTRASASCSRDLRDASSTAQETDSSPVSKGLEWPCIAHARSSGRWASSISRSELACTQESVNGSATSSAVSPSTSAHESRH